MYATRAFVNISMLQYTCIYYTNFVLCAVLHIGMLVCYIFCICGIDREDDSVASIIMHVLPGPCLCVYYTLHITHAGHAHTSYLPHFLCSEPATREKERHVGTLICTYRQTPAMLHTHERTKRIPAQCAAQQSALHYTPHTHF